MENVHRNSIESMANVQRTHSKRTYGYLFCRDAGTVFHPRTLSLKATIEETVIVRMMMTRTPVEAGSPRRNTTGNTQTHTQTDTHTHTHTQTDTHTTHTL